MVCHDASKAVLWCVRTETCESWWRLEGNIRLKSKVLSVGEGSEAWPSLSGEAYASSIATTYLLTTNTNTNTDTDTDNPNKLSLDKQVAFGVGWVG